jgi:hypothetical protein
MWPSMVGRRCTEMWDRSLPKSCTSTVHHCPYFIFYNDAAAALVVDPTDSSSLGIVGKLMKRAKSDLALFLTDLDLAEMLIKRAVRLVRRRGDGKRFDNVLVLGDESNFANQLWRSTGPEGESVFSALTRATLHNYKEVSDNVTLFVTGLNIRAFVTSTATRSIMKAYNMPILEAADIRD